MPQTDKKTTLVTDQDAQARIEELEVKLRKAELARDAYDEMINVAEAKFNIPIGKSWRQAVENLQKSLHSIRCRPFASCLAYSTKTRIKT